MFVGCFEISISLIVKHVQNIGTVRNFYLYDGISYVFPPGGQKKLLVCGLLGVGISAQAETMVVNFLHFSQFSHRLKTGIFE